jgi:hypothetical protein
LACAAFYLIPIALVRIVSGPATPRRSGRDEFIAPQETLRAARTPDPADTGRASGS